MSLYSKGHHQPWCELPKDHKGGCQNVTATEYRARIAQLEARVADLTRLGNAMADSAIGVDEAIAWRKAVAK